MGFRMEFMEIFFDFAMERALSAWFFGTNCMVKWSFVHGFPVKFLVVIAPFNVQI